MKLRILGNSIRLRLSQGDIQELQKSGELFESVQFPTATFRYGITISPVQKLEASFVAESLVVTIPSEIANAWITTDQVGMSHTLNHPGLADMDILVEKDFACLVPREGEDDLFPNPRAQKN